MIILPIWLWLVLGALGGVVWLVSMIVNAGRRAANNVRSSNALARGAAVGVGQDVVDATRRALAGYLNVAPESVPIVLGGGAVQARVDAQALSSPLYVLATADLMCIRSRQGASASTFTFVRRSDVTASGFTDPVTVWWQLHTRSVIEIRLEAPEHARQIATWLASRVES